MILTFSGTGNSSFIARLISESTGGELYSLNSAVKTNETKDFSNAGTLIFCTPTYAWRIPRVVEEWIKKCTFNGNKAYFIMTCGGEIGNSEKYLKSLCKEKNLDFYGVKEIVMPENYVAMFPVPKESTSLKIIDKAEKELQSVLPKLKNGEKLEETKQTFMGGVCSGIVNNVFYPMFVKSEKFTVDGKCIGCGKCKELCPLNNIELKDGKPEWHNNCTHCMACICHCPTEAIEYGKASVGKVRYKCPK